MPCRQYNDSVFVEYERRIEQELPKKTSSLWSHLLSQTVLYNNTNYNPQETSGVLNPSSKDIRLWAKAHFPFLEIN